MAAAREGRLYVDEKKKTVSKEQVKIDVRAYVARISPLVTRHYRSTIDELWEEIFGNDVLMDLMMPFLSKSAARFNVSFLLYIQLKGANCVQL